MLGPYTANKDRTISYRGNKVFAPIEDVTSMQPPIAKIERRVEDLKSDPIWPRISAINHTINFSSNRYFDELGALFTALPLTTRMISSPGAVYGKEAISYTSDTCPITLNWFNLPKKAFLSESSQIYLELALMQKGINQVYSIYNSFRKENADATHLSEFHHLEYEGQVSQAQNEKIALGLVGKIISDLLVRNYEDLSYFLSHKRLEELANMSDRIQNIPRITYKEAQAALFKVTGDERYKRFTMQDCFGSWEEIKLTELFGGMLAITQFPLLEVPFYHAQVDGVKHEVEFSTTIPCKITDNTGQEVNIKPLTMPAKKFSRVADNTDIIWPGYRETIGSGHRVRSEKELEEKAEIFQIPREDYQPYLQTRRYSDYVESSGFGLGWERMLQGMLEMPYIWSIAQFPRIDKTLKP
jgi:aspartyl/asparaginyl-tRNA synthetase